MKMIAKDTQGTKKETTSGEESGANSFVSLRALGG